MSGIMKPMTTWPGRFLAFASKSLVLFLLFIAALSYSLDDGGWFNQFMVFLIVSSPIALVWLFRRTRKGGGGQSVPVDK
jgi:hypothetical protein